MKANVSPLSSAAGASPTSSPLEALSRADRLVGIGLALAFGSLFVLSSPGRLETARAQVEFEASVGLLDSGRLALRDPQLNTYLAATQVVSEVAPGVPFFAAPILALARLGSEPEEELEGFAVALLPAMAAGLTVPLLFGSLRRLGQARLVAVGWTVAVALGTPFWTAAASEPGDSLKAALVAVCVVALLSSRNTPALVAPAFAGAAAGLLALYGTRSALLALPLALLASDRRSRLLAFLVGTSAGLGIASAVPALQLAPLGGEHHSLLSQVVAVTLSPGTGLLFFGPLLLLALAGAWKLRRTDLRLALAVAGGFVVQTVLAAHEAFLRTEPDWGPTEFVPWIPLAVLALPAALPKLKAALPVGLLTTVGLVTALLGLTLDPAVSRLESGARFVARASPASQYASSPQWSRVAELERAFKRWRDGRPAQFSTAPYPGRVTYAPLPALAVGSSEKLLAENDVWGLPRPWPAWLAALDPHRQFLRPVPWIALLLATFLLGGALVRAGLSSGRSVHSRQS